MKLVILAGAGMSKDSGIPTFREKSCELYYDKQSSFGYFQENPEQFWQYHFNRWKFASKKEPHQGYYDLLEYVIKENVDYFIVTTNIDGLFYKAGFNSDRILELHGSFLRYQCSKVCDFSFEVFNHSKDFLSKQHLLLTDIPRCKKCGALTRPNVLYFSDYGFYSTQINKEKVKFNNFLANTASAILLELGVGEVQRSIKSFHLSLRKNIKGTSFYINMEDTKDSFYAKKYIGSAKEQIINWCNDVKRIIKD